MRAPVGVKMQAFNWRLWHARREAGLSQAQLGLLIGSHAQRIGVIETFKSRPTAEEQDEIASALNVPAHELFPPEVLDLYGPTAATLRFAVPAARLRELRDAGQSADPAQLVSGLREQVDDVVGMLTLRQQAVLKARYGLDDEPEQTLDAVGRAMGTGRERVRQIEAKALRTLRHPMRSKLVKPYLETDSARIPQGRALTLAERRAYAVRSHEEKAGA